MRELIVRKQIENDYNVRVPRFADRFREIMTDYFSTKKSLCHYINMAEGNYREFLRGEMVKTKKYFYVLRPVLTCMWVIDRKTPPPMLFSALASAELPGYLRPEVERLLDLKMNSPEVREIPRIDILNEYLDESITDIKSRIACMEDPDNNWVKLNDLFLQTIAMHDQER